jgi:hypothetical protein
MVCKDQKKGAGGAWLDNLRHEDHIRNETLWELEHDLG